MYWQFLINNIKGSMCKMDWVIEFDIAAFIITAIILGLFLKKKNYPSKANNMNLQNRITAKVCCNCSMYFPKALDNEFRHCHCLYDYLHNTAKIG